MKHFWYVGASFVSCRPIFPFCQVWAHFLMSIVYRDISKGVGFPSTCSLTHLGLPFLLTQNKFSVLLLYVWCFIKFFWEGNCLLGNAIITSVIFQFSLFSEWHTPWWQHVNWMFRRYSEEVLDVFWAFYVHLIPVLCPGCSV